MCHQVFLDGSVFECNLISSTVLIIFHSIFCTLSEGYFQMYKCIETISKSYLVLINNFFNHEISFPTNWLFQIHGRRSSENTPFLSIIMTLLHFFQNSNSSNNIWIWFSFGICIPRLIAICTKCFKTTVGQWWVVV